MGVRKTWGPICTIIAGAALLVGGGCAIQVVPDGGSGSNTTSAATIAVKIVNNTSEPLDPEIYIGSVGAGIEGLFVPENKQTNFGVGGLGIMLPYSETSFTVKCGELGLMGTTGGIFGDDLTDPIGSGRQVVLEEEVNVQCGDQVIFAFSAQGTTLTTTYGVALQGRQ